MSRKAAHSPTDPAPVPMFEPEPEPTPTNGAAEPVSARRASLRQHRISQDYDSAARQVIVAVPVQRPPKKSFIRVHPDEDYADQFFVLEGADEIDRTAYLVAEPVVQVFGSAVRPVRLVTAVTALGGVFLWPLKLPDGRAQTESWTRSALEIAERAKHEWLRVETDMELRIYHGRKGDPTLFGAPKWPAETFDQLLELAFPEATVINDGDHPVVARWLGRAG